MSGATGLSRWFSSFQERSHNVQIISNIGIPEGKLQNIRSIMSNMAARSKAYVFGRSPAEIVGSNPPGGMDVCLL
jgi:hypothetical protein